MVERDRHLNNNGQKLMVCFSLFPLINQFWNRGSVVTAISDSSLFIKAVIFLLVVFIFAVTIVLVVPAASSLIMQLVVPKY